MEMPCKEVGQGSRGRRCHPDIAAVANAHFYGGRLLTGCGAASRAPLLPRLPPLLALDTRGQADYAGGSHSASNRAEARAVVKARAFPPCGDCR
jgi:superfamily I DNA and/or RNA helicase